jgi:hypothetical protein
VAQILKRIVSRTRTAGMARALAPIPYLFAALWLAAIVAATAAYVVMAAPDTRAFAWALIAAILAAAFGATYLSEWGDLYGQRARDIRAAAVFKAVRAGKPAPAYTLYLRPFASTNVISQTDFSTALGVSPLGVGFGALSGERVELEEQIERAVRPLGPLIALGAPLEHFGAGRVPVREDEWQGAIQQLMERAGLIVMLPSSRAGTLKEIGMVLESDLARKTVFLDPPRLGSHRVYDKSKEWASVREAFAQRGYRLPDATRRGALMFFGSDKTDPLREWLDIDAEDRIERMFKTVLKRVRAAAA